MATVYLAEPMLRFRCNLKGCCCKGWGIPFGPQDATALLVAFPPEERAEILRGASFETDDQRKITAVRLRQEPPDGACQFLTKEGLCGAQMRLGVAVLPYICRAFPAFAMTTGSEVELYFDPVCPEVMERIADPDGPMTFVKVQPEPDSDLAVRSSRMRPFEEITIGNRSLVHSEYDLIRARILQALSDWSRPALERLAQIHLAVGRLMGGQPVEAFEVERDRSVEGFDEYFDQCVSCHDSRILGRYWVRLRRFVFEPELAVLEVEGLVPHLEYDPKWHQQVDLLEPMWQPLLYRFLAHSFFSTYLHHPETSRLSMSYGTVTHTLGTAIRYALAFASCLGRPVALTDLKVGLSASSLLYRVNVVPPEAMPWFRPEGR
ncbi:MAG: YkgJ family cysteine cluster protein [Bradymonadales bacterium]|nr:YkgJ family cysteine cluster protein [Bradymonadales bacterium]